MFYSAYLGNDESSFPWQEVMHRHANWLGLSCYIESRTLSDGRNFSFGWLERKASDRNAHLQETKEYLLMTTSDSTTHEEDMAITGQPWQGLIESVDRNVITVGLSLRSGELRVAVPPATPEQFYFAKDSRGWVLGNDMRLLVRWAGLELDERAVYALFQYGAIPPPFTMSKTVQRVPGGHVLKIMPDSDEPAFEVFFQLARESQKIGKSSNPEIQVQETLDSILARVPTGAVLYFSGGVDSGLMAARLVEMGRTDVRLINYAFGPQDEEGHLALQMAAHLGLECEQIMYEPSDIPSMLERLGKDYSYPFGDYSAVPTNLLVHASLPSAERSSVVIEGNGAEGAFATGYAARLRYPMHSLPYYSVASPMRWMISEGYKRLKLWRYNSKVARVGGAARRSIRMPLQHSFVIAQNPLDGIAYTIPGKVREDLGETIRDRIQVLSVGLGYEDQCSLLDLAICGRRMAAKIFDPLRRRGMKPIYPFLEAPMLRLSFSMGWDQKCEGGEIKGLLKKMLARRVPRGLVYRRKSGFTPPFKEMLTLPSMQEFLRNVVMSRENPLIDFCRTDTVEKIIERSAHGKPLSSGVYNFLWVLIFTSGWLRQQEF